MKYNNKTQIARQKYLEGIPLSEEERKTIEKDLSGSDFQFFMSGDESFILPEKYDASNTYPLVEKQIMQRPPSKRIPFTRYIGYAAAVLVLALFSTIAYNYMKQPQMLYAETSFGEKKEIALPDGSTVTLNSMSSLEYPEKMSGKTREVKLKGEAYFDVAKNPEKTFIVKADDIEVKVLGTRFNIKAYEKQEYITTTLFEGIVSVGMHARPAQKLVPGEQAVFLKKTETIETRRLKDTVFEEAWRNNVLAFDNEPLADILDELSREYGVSFDLNDDRLKELRITARFSSSETADKALAILGESAKFSFSREGNNYKIVTKE